MITMDEERPFTDTMRKAATSLRDAARRVEGTKKAGLYHDHATLCAVWNENAGLLSIATQRDFRKLALQWVKDAGGAPLS